MSNITAKYDLLTVIPTVQATPDYAAGDVLFAPTEIHNFFKDEGSAFLMDISNVHSVWNRSNKPRIHMIIHYEIGRRVRDFFYVLRESYFTNRG